MLDRFFIIVYLVGFIFTYGHAYTNFVASTWIETGSGVPEVAASILSVITSFVWPLYWSTQVF